MEDYLKQLRKYLENQGVTQEQIAAEFGVSKSAINQLLTGRRPFGKQSAKRWGDKFGLSVAWLLTGEGEMFRGSSAAPATAIAAGESSIAVNTNNGNIGGIPALIEHIEFLRRSIADRDKIIETYKRLVEAQERQLQMLQSQVTEYGTKNNPK